MKGKERRKWCASPKIDSEFFINPSARGYQSNILSNFGAPNGPISPVA